MVEAEVNIIFITAEKLTALWFLSPYNCSKQRKPPAQTKASPGSATRALGCTGEFIAQEEDYTAGVHICIKEKGLQRVMPSEDEKSIGCQNILYLGFCRMSYFSDIVGCCQFLS